MFLLLAGDKPHGRTIDSICDTETFTMSYGLFAKANSLGVTVFTRASVH
jgi:hypothetical protein